MSTKKLKKQKLSVFSTLILIGWIIITAVSLHSVQEIHYFKTFYPQSFTVTEAGYATIVELIKVALISFPIILLGLF